MSVSVSELRRRMSSLRQYAAVRQMRLEDGPSAGQRVLAFSTGAGLDFWILADRTMDVGPLWIQGVPMYWLHPNEFPHSIYLDPEGDQLTGVERGLSGFLVTCGLDNVRQPRNGLPLHGHLPFTPARVIAHGECWDVEVPYLYAEGEVVSAHLNRSSYRLFRRIVAPIGEMSLKITDHIENIGSSPIDTQVLYHTNLGYPLVDSGFSVTIGSSLGSSIRSDIYATEPADSIVSCHSLAEITNPVVTVSNVGSTFVPPLTLTIEQSVATLPYIQFWQDSRPGRNILAIEPVNCNRNEDGTSQPGIILNSGESMTTHVRYDFEASPPRHDENPSR